MYICIWKACLYFTLWRRRHIAAVICLASESIWKDNPAIGTMCVLCEVFFLQFVYFTLDLRYFTIIIVIQKVMRQRKPNSETVAQFRIAN